MLGRTRLKRRFFLDGLLWLFLLEFGIMVMSLEPGFLDFDNLPDTNFTCVGKVIGGYYADLETNCQMFHVCTIGQSDEPMDIRFLCLNGTVFDQETRVCERIDEVDCSKSEQFYSLNLELYGNTQPAIQEESPDESDTDRPVPKSTTTTTTKRPLTTKLKRPPFYTSTSSPVATTASSSQGGKHSLLSNHFSSVSSTDIRFNPEEINISLNAGAPPDIRSKHHQPYKTQFSDNSNYQVNKHSNNMFSDNSDNNNSPYDNDNSNNHQINDNHPPSLYSHNSNLQVTAQSSQYSDLGKMPMDGEDSTTQTSKSVFTVNHNNPNSENIHSSNSDLKTFLNIGKFADPNNVKFAFSSPSYQTEYPQVFRFSNPDNYKPSQSFLPQISEDVFHNKQATITYHPPRSATTTRTIYLQSFKPPNLEDHSQYQTEKPPQRIQIPIPVLPTLPPLTFSSPAPFSLTRHIDAKRYTKDHPSPPRIIISASASVTDDSGRRLNYSLGTIGAAQILDTPPASYDDYKDGDVGLDPFYHDVPKVRRRRRKRSVEFETHKKDSQPAVVQNFKHLEMLKNPKDIEEILKFFGTIKDEEDLERLLPKRSADPQQPQSSAKINVFDIIRNEKEAVEVLKFLFTWYKSHQATATAPPITIPVSPEIISRINYEFAPKDSQSDSSELRYTSNIREFSTSTPTLFTPKNIPVMYLDYLDGVKFETRQPKLDNNIPDNKNQHFESKVKENQSNLDFNLANEAVKNFSYEPVFDVNDYVNDNYEPEILKYWGKQNDKDLPTATTTEKISQASIKPNIKYNNEPFRESIPLPTLFPPKKSSDKELLLKKNIPLSKPRPLPPKESINSLTKEILVQHYYLSSTDESRSPVLNEETSEGPDSLFHPHLINISNTSSSTEPYSENSTGPHDNLETTSTSNFEESANEDHAVDIINSTETEEAVHFTTTGTTTSTTTTTGTKFTTARNRHRGRNRYPYNESQIYLNNKMKDDSSTISHSTSDHQTTTSTETSVSTKITKKYRRITTTRPLIRGRSRFNNKKLTTTEIPVTTTREVPLEQSKNSENFEYTTNIEITTNEYTSENNDSLAEIFYNSDDSNATSTVTYNPRENRKLNLNILDLNFNLKNQQENNAFYTELPLSIEIQPPYEIEKLKDNNSVGLRSQPPEHENDDFELFKSILKTYNPVSTTQETVVPIFYKNRNRVESDHTMPTKQPVRNLEIVLNDDTTTVTQEDITTTTSRTDLTNNTAHKLNISSYNIVDQNVSQDSDYTHTNLPIADTTATTPVVSYAVEDVLATTFPTITEANVPEQTEKLPETTTRKSKNHRKFKPNYSSIGKSRFAMNIQHHSIKKQLTVDSEENSTTTQSSGNPGFASPNLLLNEYIFSTSTETITRSPLEIAIPLDDIGENTPSNQAADENTSHTKTEIVSTNKNIKSLLLKEKVGTEEDTTATEKNRDDSKSIKRGRFKFLDHYSTTTPENLEEDDEDDQKIESGEIPKIPYEGLRANTEDQKYSEDVTHNIYENQQETTTMTLNSNDHDGAESYTEIEKNPTTLLEDTGTLKSSTQKSDDHVQEFRSDKVQTVPQILKYLISEIETTTSEFANVETTMFSSDMSSNSGPQNFFVEHSNNEAHSDYSDPILMDTTETATTQSSVDSVYQVATESMNKTAEIPRTPSDQQMKLLKNSSHLLQVLVENSTSPVEETTMPVTSTTTVASFYRRRNRPTRIQATDKNKQFGRHRFSTELFTRNPIDVTKNEIEGSDKITDTPLHRSVPPTSEITKTSTTPIWRRSYGGSSKKVGSKYVFNCFGKQLHSFYSDPRDCRLFHFCTQGYSKNQLLDLKYVCDLETYFDDEKLICSKVKPKRCL